MDRLTGSVFTIGSIPGLLAAAVIASSAVLFPREASGQTPVDRIHAFMESASGFNLLGDIQRGILRTNDTMSIAVTLLEGAEYMVVAYCGEDCGNLDLTLLDASGVEVQSDRLPDTEPILALSAEETGEFKILAQTGECPEPGYYVAVGIMGSTDEPGAIPGEDMSGRLEIFGMEVKNLGFKKVGQEARGGLKNEEAIQIPIPLQKGMEYRIAGTCDLDCFDLDLAIFDPQGQEVTGDFLEDDFPILGLIPDNTGVFQLEVIMVACGLEPCAFRTVAYSREVQLQPEGADFSGEVVSYRTIQGELDRDDEQLWNTYFEVYEVDLEAGQRLILDLRSEDFDTLLRLFDPEGQLQEYEGQGSEPRHSHLEVMATKEGKYSVHVASSVSFATGDYALQIAVMR